MISLDKCNESCNAADYLSTKICVPRKRKDVNVKVFNMITVIDEAKTFHVIVNANLIAQHVIQLKNGIMIIVKANVKSIASVTN